MATRNRLVNVRMLESEVAMLATLAEREGVSQSEWIRNVIRREHAILGVAPRRTKAKPKG